MARCKVFEMVNHPTARRAYAWSYATEGIKRTFVAVLQGDTGVIHMDCAIE